MWGIANAVLIWIAIVAVAFLIWVLIELALTIRKARSSVSDLQERLEPTLSHLEQITSSLEPVVTKIDPLVERAQLTVDALNLELMQVDKILNDASDMTGTANSAVNRISNVAGAPRKIVVGAADRLRATFGKKVDAHRVESAIEDRPGRNLDASTEDSGSGSSGEADPASVRAAREWAANLASQPGAADAASGEAREADAEEARSGSDAAKAYPASSEDDYFTSLGKR